LCGIAYSGDSEGGDGESAGCRDGTHLGFRNEVSLS